VQALTKTHIFGLYVHSSGTLGSINWELVKDFNVLLTVHHAMILGNSPT